MSKPLSKPAGSRAAKPAPLRVTYQGEPGANSHIAALEMFTGCEAVASTGSNIGCEFWAVDLDNEYNFTNDAAGAPWGVVIAEASAAGLPVICSSACGAASDLVRSYFNGVVVPPETPAALARAMRWIHERQSELPEIGRRGQSLAAAFSAESWAVRWHNYLIEAVDASDTAEGRSSS